MDSANILPGNQLHMNTLESFIIYQCIWMDTLKLMVQKSKCRKPAGNENGTHTAAALINNDIINDITSLESYINGTYALMEILNSMVQEIKNHKNCSESATHSNGACNMNSAGENLSQFQYVEIRSQRNLNRTDTDDLQNVLATTTQQMPNIEAENTMNENGSDQVTDDECNKIQEVNADSAINQKNVDQNHKIMESNEFLMERRSMSLCLDDDTAVAENKTETETVANERHTNFSCDICGESFDTKICIIKHMKLHQGKRVLTCYICNKRFGLLRKLRIHLANHSPGKLFPCEICGKDFSQMGSLKRHFRIHAGEKPFSCEICGKKFRHNHHLKNHLRIHTGEKPFSCKTCGKKFVHSNALTRHLKIHTGEKAFSCETCGKRFKQTSNLTTHLRAHTEENPFSCEICGKKFRQNNSLKIHSRIHQK